MSRRRRRSREVEEDDEGAFRYFSMGKAKSMKVADFQRQTAFKKKDIRRLLNIMFEFVGPLNELASRFVGLRGKDGNLVSANTEETQKVRAMIGDLVSLGIVKYVSHDGEYDTGSYYSFTEEGAELYIKFLVDKLPKITKEVVRAFIEGGEDSFFLPSLYLLMFIGSDLEIDPLLTSAHAREGQWLRLREVLKSYLDYQTRVMLSDRADIEGYKKKIKSKMKKLVDRGLIEIQRKGEVDYAFLTPSGRKAVKPALSDMSNFISDTRDYEHGIMLPDRRRGASGFVLTKLGIAVRRKYAEVCADELIARRPVGDVTDPPMPIENVSEKEAPVYTLTMTTGKGYGSFKRFTARVKKFSFVPIFYMFVAVCIFMALVSLSVLKSVPLALIFTALFFLAIIFACMIRGIQEARRG